MHELDISHGPGPHPELCSTGTTLESETLTVYRFDDGRRFVRTAIGYVQLPDEVLDVSGAEGRRADATPATVT